jgi:streptogramin lyase
MTFKDEKGRTWSEFTVSYRHEIDEMTMNFTILAINFADAQERLDLIKANARLDGKLEK